MKVDYSCDCINNDGDITYGAEFDTYDEAVKYVDHYRELIQNNGEENEHSHIQICKNILDVNDDIISSKVLKTYNIEERRSA